ncbi:MAG: hypothetical protein QGI33_04090 [Candidatus Brocadiia bacterium]|nr:hypothetical protein [Candidatus Brocadiia bacterium]
MTTLSDESRKAVDEYLRKLEAGLTDLPEDVGADAVAETRSHIEEAVARIREDEAAAVGTVLRGLGEPEAFAEGLVDGDFDDGERRQGLSAVLPPPVRPTPTPFPPTPARRPNTTLRAGCMFLVLLPVAWIIFQIPEWTRPTKPESGQQQWMAQHETMQQLAVAIQARETEVIEALLHPDFVAEAGVTGADLLMPAGVGMIVRTDGGPVPFEPDAVEHGLRGIDQMGSSQTVLAANVYTLKWQNGEWLISGVREWDAPPMPAP